MFSTMPYVRLHCPDIIHLNSVAILETRWVPKSMCGLLSPRKDVWIDHSSILDHSCYLIASPCMNHLLQPEVKCQVHWIRNTYPESHKNAVSCNYFLGCSHWERVRGAEQELSPHVLSSKPASERGNHGPKKCTHDSKGQGSRNTPQKCGVI